MKGKPGKVKWLKSILNRREESDIYLTHVYSRRSRQITMKINETGAFISYRGRLYLQFHIFLSWSAFSDDVHRYESDRCHSLPFFLIYFFIISFKCISCSFDKTTKGKFCWKWTGTSLFHCFHLSNLRTQDNRAPSASFQGSGPRGWETRKIIINLFLELIVPWRFIQMFTSSNNSSSPLEN